MENRINRSNLKEIRSNYHVKPSIIHKLRWVWLLFFHLIYLSSNGQNLPIIEIDSITGHAKERIPFDRPFMLKVRADKKPLDINLLTSRKSISWQQMLKERENGMKYNAFQNSIKELKKEIKGNGDSLQRKNLNEILKSLEDSVIRYKKTRRIWRKFLNKEDGQISIPSIPNEHYSLLTVDKRKYLFIRFDALPFSLDATGSGNQIIEPSTNFALIHPKLDLKGVEVMNLYHKLKQGLKQDQRENGTRSANPKIAKIIAQIEQLQIQKERIDSVKIANPTSLKVIERVWVQEEKLDSIKNVDRTSLNVIAQFKQVWTQSQKWDSMRRGMAKKAIVEHELKQLQIQKDKLDSVEKTSPTSAKVIELLEPLLRNKERLGLIKKANPIGAKVIEQLEQLPIQEQKLDSTKKANPAITKMIELLEQVQTQEQKLDSFKEGYPKSDIVIRLYETLKLKREVRGLEREIRIKLQKIEEWHNYNYGILWDTQEYSDLEDIYQRSVKGHYLSIDTANMRLKNLRDLRKNNFKLKDSMNLNVELQEFILRDSSVKEIDLSKATRILNSLHSLNDTTYEDLLSGKQNLIDKKVNKQENLKETLNQLNAWKQIYFVANSLGFNQGRQYRSELVKLCLEIEEIIRKESIIRSKKISISSKLERYFVKMETFGGTSNVLSFESRNALRVVPDFGLIGYGFQKDFFGISPYLGFQVNLRNMDKDIPLRIYPNRKLIHRLSFGLGYTLVSVAEEGRRDDFFNKSALMIGGGFKVSQSVKLTFGTLVFKEENPNPIISRKRLSFTPYAGVSLDLELQKLFNGIGSLIPKK